MSEMACAPTYALKTLTKSLKETGKKITYESACNLIAENLAQDRQLIFCMPQKTALIKSINRARAKGRPTHVSSLEFTLNTTN